MQQITVEGTTWDVGPRILRIILWLLDNARRIEEIERGRITFNYAGDSVSTELSEAKTLNKP